MISNGYVILIALELYLYLSGVHFRSIDISIKHLSALIAVV